MASIPPTNSRSVTPPLPPSRAAGTDSDGDNDGSKAGASKAAPPAAQFQTKPTETKGNNVNTSA